MNRLGIKHLLIISSILTICICMSSVSFASDSSHTVHIDAGNDTLIPINSIDKDGTRHLFLPSGTTEDKLIFDENDDISNYEVMTDENIGSLHFYSDDPENYGMDYIHNSQDHSTKAPGSIILLDENGNIEYQGGVEAIKGRGNSTWRSSDKKPYQIKLAKKANLLNISDDTQKAKKWILLANAFDTTLIRNEIAYSLAKEMGLEATPEGKQVELYYDGEYRGLYFLCEKVEIGNGRIEINDMEDNPEITTGGYLLEIDKMYYRNEPAYFIDKLAGPIVCKSPEEPTPDQIEYIQGIVSEAMQCIENGGKSPDSDKTLFDYFDRDSLVRYFLVNEWIVNADAYLTSTYIYKSDNSDKLFMGPIWDCDYSMGRSATKGAYRRWYLPLLADDLIKIPEFRQALQDEYVNNMRPLIKDTLLGESNLTYLKTYSETADRLNTAAIMNHKAWTLMAGGEGVKYWPIKIDELNKWLNYRNEWFDTAITDEGFVEETWNPAGRSGNEDTGSIPSQTAQRATNQDNNTSSSLNPSKPKVKIKAKKKNLSLTFTKAKKASGYQIRYYQEKDNNRTTKYKKTKSNKVKLKKLKRKTMYIVQVRAYRSLKGKIYYSPWLTKCVKTK